MTEKRSRKQTHNLALGALFTALVAVTTVLLKIPLPISGYLNLGDAVIFIATLALPVRLAVFAAAVGSALADITSNYAHYAIFTLFIKGAEVLVIFGIRKLLRKDLNWIAFFFGGVVMALLYALVDGLMLISFEQFMLSLGYNLIQGIASAVIVTLFLKPLTGLIEQLRSLDT